MSGLTRGDEKEVCTGAPAGRPASILVVVCVSYHEYVELHNGGPTTINLSGWQIRDALEHSYGLCADAIDPGEFLLCSGSFSLNNSGDTVKLVDRNGSVIDTYSYGNTRYDVPWSRTVDGGGVWTETYPASPGGPNLPATDTPTPTVTLTPTPTPTATAYPLGVMLNEFLPSPKEVDWNRNGTADLNDEWIELHNGSDQAVDLGGWMLDDEPENAGAATEGSTPYVIPAGTVMQPRGFLVFYRSTTGVVLNNNGDEVRLLGPDGALLDGLSYGSVAGDVSYSRTVDGSGTWTSGYPPSPGAPNLPAADTPTPTVTLTPTPTPTATPYPLGVMLNEFLPSPKDVDWDGNGTADLTDEWIELYNGSGQTIDLGGWMLDDAAETAVAEAAAAEADAAGGSAASPEGSPVYSIPPGTIIGPGGLLVFYRRQTGVVLNNDGDEVRLLGPDGVLLDGFTYSVAPGDRSWSRTVDGGGGWTLDHPPTPGRSNQAGLVWRFWGAAYEGAVGDVSHPLSGARLDLYGYYRLDGEAHHLRSQTTGQDGWYGLITDNEYPHYLIVQTGPYGYVSLGATSGSGGEVQSPNEILFNEPAPGIYHLDNDFWNMKPEDLPTPTPTTTPEAGPVTAGDVLVNEVQYDPQQSGTEAAYEWLELLNTRDRSVDLAGWLIQDNNGTDELPTLVLPAAGLGVVVGDETAFRGSFPHYAGLLISVADGKIGNGLANDGDRLRLLLPDGGELDALSYGDDISVFDPPASDVSEGHSLCRQPSGYDSDLASDWLDCAEPSPGEHNAPPVATDTPTPLPAETYTPTSTSTATPTVTATSIPTITPTPTVTPTATPYPLGVVLNEFLPAPKDVDWDGDGSADAGDEWIELYNGSGQVVDLGGWLLDDEAETDTAEPSAAGLQGTAPFVIPAGTIIHPGGFVVSYRRDTGIALNNDGDDVRFLGPDGVLLDSVTYGSAARDGSWSRTLDGSGEWTPGYPPSPGQANLPATPTVTATVTPTPTLTPTPTPYPLGVVLNEFLPSPKHVDWDGDGSADLNDEWIELYNGSGQAVDLGGWVLDDEADAAAASLQSSQPYVIPSDTIIEPGRFLLFFRRDTKLALNNTGDEVRFLGPDGALLDVFAYASSPGVDVSWSRSEDGEGYWTTGYPPSPGASNRPPPPTATPTPVPPLVIVPGVNTPIHLSIEIARTYPLDTWLIVEGQVTVVPPHFGRSLYIQDHTGGIMVSLGQGEFPPLSEGDWLRVDGRLRNYHGERRVWVSRSMELLRTGAGEPVQPQVIRSGDVDEAHEGLLVQVFGPAVSFGSQSFDVDGGSGAARVYVRDSVAFRRPSIQVGEPWSVVGIVSQYVVSAPHVGGYRLLPRYETDLRKPPLLLPVTGGVMADCTWMCPRPRVHLLHARDQSLPEV